MDTLALSTQPTDLPPSESDTAAHNRDGLPAIVHIGRLLPMFPLDTGGSIRLSSWSDTSVRLRLPVCPLFLFVNAEHQPFPAVAEQPETD